VGIEGPTPASRLVVVEQKKAIESINSRLQLVMKSGKAALGYKQTIKTLRGNKGERACRFLGRPCQTVLIRDLLALLLFTRHIAKVVIISNNCPPLTKSEIEYYAMLSKTETIHYNGSNTDLGTACGKYFRVSVLSVTDAGDSDIIRPVAEA
jgi:large subunit ribosomal protein L30e